MKTIATAVGWACSGAYVALTFALAAAQGPALLARPRVSLELHRQHPDRDGEGRLGPGGHTRTVTVGPAMRRYRVHVGKSTKDISANDVMWEFFQKHPLKPSAAPKSQPTEKP